MADIKWIKVAVDMFEDSKIEFIRSLPEGDAIIVTWIQMLSIAGQSNSGGYLMVAEGIPYTEQLLSNKLRRQPVLLQFALETLQKLKMINVEDGPYHISKWEKHQNVDGMEKVRLQTAQRVAKHRLRNKEAIQNNNNVTLPVALPVTDDVTHGNAIELELELELEKEKDSTTTPMNPFKLFETEGFGTLSSVIGDKIGNFIDDFGERWVCEAMKEASYQGKRSLPYVKGILDRYITSGVDEPWNSQKETVNGSSNVGKTGKAAKWKGYRDAFLEGDGA